MKVSQPQLSKFNIQSLEHRCHYEAFKGAITRTGGKLMPAAKLLGLSLPTARKHAKKLGLWPKMKKKKGTNGKAKKIQK